MADETGYINETLPGTSKRTPGPLMSPLRGQSSQEPDLELGASTTPVGAGTPSRYSGLDRFINSVDQFMVCRRFGALHARLILQRQDDLMHLEQQLQELDEGMKVIEKKLSQYSELMADERVRIRLIQLDPMISSMMSLTQTPMPSARRYRNVREYLVQGPPIHMDHSEVRGTRWAEYESVVKNLLMEPEIAPWLDGPVDQDWSGRPYQEKKEVKIDTTWISRQVRRCDNITMGGCVLFWITHVTAALGFVLTSNTSEHQGHPMSEM